MTKPAHSAANDSDPQMETSQRFTAAVSHEIRTPLNGILGMVSLLEETGLSPVQKEYVDAIRKSGSRLLDLLNNVLDYSRLETGEIPLDLSPFDPAELIQDVAELLAPRAHKANLDLAAAVLPGSPDKIIGDAGRIRQIIFNLAGNAIKFTEAGGVLITAEATPDDRFIFSVQDTGCGIPEEDKARIFNAFGQVSASDAGKDSGVGLGLAIALRLADAMGGEISVSSQKGEGACFRFSLPLAPAAIAQESPPSTATPLRVALDATCASQIAVMAALADSTSAYCLVARNRKADVAIVDASLPPARIQTQARKAPTLVILRPEDRNQIPTFRDMGCVGYLIRPLRAHSVAERVMLAAKGGEIADQSDTQITTATPGARALIADDNPVNSLLAKRALAAAGFAVDTAGTGAEAVEAVTKTPYSIIFMDVRMPVMDGLEATRRIREMETDVANTPIIALTADIDPDLESNAEKAGVTMIASKPIDPTRLRALALENANFREAKA